MIAPIKLAQNGRTLGGRFEKGHPGGPGRPRGLDFRAVVTARVEAEGRSIEEVIVDLFKATLARALEGDVVASKLLIERLCGKVELPVEVKQDVRPQMTDMERASRLNAILESARRRQEEFEAAKRELLGQG